MEKEKAAATFLRSVSNDDYDNDNNIINDIIIDNANNSSDCPIQRTPGPTARTNLSGRRIRDVQHQPALPGRFAVLLYLSWQMEQGTASQ